MRRIATINPVDNKPVKRFKEVSDRTVQGYITAAKNEFTSWKSASLTIKAKYLKTVAELLRSDTQWYAELITLEMGKPVREARAEIEKCALVCDYYADNAKQFLQDDDIQTDASHSYVTYEPLGIVLGIMPWNFPFWQVFRFAVPALMSGNVVFLKHASNVPQCAQAIMDVFRQGNIPRACFQTLFISQRQTRRLISNPDIKMISLTGSDAAGSAVAAIAGSHIKKTVLELGGNDPFIVLEDANLKSAAETAVQSRMLNAGQSCIAAKRLIVVAAVKDQFTELLKELIGNIKVGDPTDESVDMGPLAREDLARSVIKQIRESVKKGARLLLGGGRPKSRGAFVNPALLVDVKPGMPAFDDELFGPVAAVVTVADEQEAIDYANRSVYGLGASIWTEDTEKANRLAKQVNSGSVFINSMVKSDPRVPFGGINRSGYGRELSHFGIKEFVNIKTIWIA